MKKLFLCSLVGFTILNILGVTTKSAEIITLEQKELIEKNGYSITIVERIEDTENWGFEPSGLFNPTKKEITLDSGYIDWAWDHEYGHFIAYINDSIDMKSEFVEIYKEENSKMFDDFYGEEGDQYYKSSSSEYFAESYKIFLNQPGLLKERAPKTFEFIKDINIEEMLSNG